MSQMPSWHSRAVQPVWYSVTIMDDNTPETPDGDETLKEMQEAMQDMHPEEEPKEDLFDTDALGHEPAPEKDTGRGD